jgi:hypothetical protein
VEVLHPIDHFVLASVLTQLPTLMTATTVTRCRLLAINAGGLLTWWSAKHPSPTRYCVRYRASSVPWYAKCAT